MVPYNQRLQSYVSKSIDKLFRTIQFRQGVRRVIGTVSLEDLSNVSGATPTDGEVLEWSQTQGLWIPGAGGGGGTIPNLQSVMNQGAAYSGTNNFSMASATSSIIDQGFNLAIGHSNGTGDESLTTMAGSSLWNLSSGSSGTAELVLDADASVKLNWKDGVTKSELLIDGTQMLVTDANNTKGLEYAGAYKSFFTLHSLVDKDYVDTEIAGIPAGPTIGGDNTIPFSNAAGTDFDYNSNFLIDGTTAAMGASLDANRKLNLYNSNNTGTDTYGIWSQIQSSSGSGADNVAGRFYSTNTGGDSNVKGLRVTASASSTATGDLTGVQIGVSTTGSAIIPRAVGLEITGVDAGGTSSTITDAYGVYIDAFNQTGTITNSYGVYQAGANDLNYFGGEIRIGSPALSVSSGYPFYLINEDTNGDRVGAVFLQRGGSSGKRTAISARATGGNSTKVALDATADGTTGSNIGVRSSVGYSTGSNTGFNATSILNGNQGTTYAFRSLFTNSVNTPTNTFGIYHEDVDSAGAAEKIGGYFDIGGGTTNYSLQLKDGTETVGGGKFLKDTGDGKAQWADITSSDLPSNIALVGTYTSGYVPRWNATTNTLESASIRDNGSQIALGTGPSSTKLYNGLFTANGTGDDYSFFTKATTNGSASGGTAHGGQIEVNGTAAGANNMKALVTKAAASGTANMTSLEGLTVIATADGTGTVGSIKGLNINSVGVGTGKTVTNVYGIYINPLYDAGTISTDRYAIYQAESSDPNYLAGQLRLGHTAGTQGQFLKAVDAAGNAEWADVPAGVTATSGASTQVAVFDGTDSINGDANFTYSSDTLTIQDNIIVKGDGSADAGKITVNCFNNNHYVDIKGPDHNNNPLSYSIQLPNKIAAQSVYSSNGRILEVDASGNGQWINTPSAGAASIGELSDAATPATDNVGLGSGALSSITTGDYNVAVGVNAGLGAAGASRCVFIGNDAGRNVSSRSDCVAVGEGAMGVGTGGNTNIAVGANALSGVTGQGNVGIGNSAGSSITSGGYSLFLGRNANGLNTQSYQIALGTSVTTTQGYSLALGTINKLLLHGDFATSGRTKLGVNLGNTYSAPTANLHVKGNASDTTTFLVQNGAGSSILQANQNGNIGIGTTAPQEKLHISTGNDLNSGDISFLIGGTAGTNARTGRIIKNTSSSYEMTIRASDFATGSDLLLNDTGGNVGIGTTSPAEALDVSGNVKVGGQAYSATHTLTAAASVAPDFDNSNVQTVTLDQATTLANPTNLKDGATYIVIVKQPAGANHTLAFGTAYKFEGGTDPTITAANGATDVLTFVSDGTNLYGAAALNFS